MVKLMNNIRLFTTGNSHTTRSEKSWRIANPFYLVAALWVAILVFYSLSWSNLCTVLDPLLIVFVLVLILSFVLFGRYFQNQLMIQHVNEHNERQMEITSTVICLVLVAGMVYNANIPLLAVLQGQPYNTEVTNLPIVGTFFTATALWQTSRLCYCYQVDNTRSTLIQLIVLFSFFLITVQRQNIMVCILAVIFSIWTCSYKGKHYSASASAMAIILLLTVLMAALFVFGAIGNARYGTWLWNDSSMISAVGEINDGYPAWLPREFIWAYVYLVSPLANLNNNLSNVTPIGDFWLVILQLLPSSLSRRMMPAFEIAPYLVQPSLTASTAYVGPYIIGGSIGMFVFMAAQQLLIFIMMTAALHDRGSAKFAGIFAVFYYAGLTFFDNPSSYLITSYLWCVVVLHSYWPQIAKIALPFLRKELHK